MLFINNSSSLLICTQHWSFGCILHTNCWWNQSNPLSMYIHHKQDHTKDYTYMLNQIEMQIFSWPNASLWPVQSHFHLVQGQISKRKGSFLLNDCAHFIWLSSWLLCSVTEITHTHTTHTHTHNHHHHHELDHHWFRCWPFQGQTINLSPANLSIGHWVTNFSFNWIKT